MFVTQLPHWTPIKRWEHGCLNVLCIRNDSSINKWGRRLEEWRAWKERGCVEQIKKKKERNTPHETMLSVHFGEKTLISTSHRTRVFLSPSFNLCTFPNHSGRKAQCGKLGGGEWEWGNIVSTLHPNPSDAWCFQSSVGAPRDERVRFPSHSLYLPV